MFLGRALVSLTIWGHEWNLSSCLLAWYVIPVTHDQVLLGEPHHMRSTVNLSSCLLACLLAWLLAWLVGWLVSWLLGWLVSWLVGCLVSLLLACLLAWLLGWLLGYLLACLLAFPWLASYKLVMLYGLRIASYIDWNTC